MGMRRLDRLLGTISPRTAWVWAWAWVCGDDGALSCQTCTAPPCRGFRGRINQIRPLCRAPYVPMDQFCMVLLLGWAALELELVLLGEAPTAYRKSTRIVSHIVLSCYACYITGSTYLEEKETTRIVRWYQHWGFKLSIISREGRFTVFRLKFKVPYPVSRHRQRNDLTNGLIFSTDRSAVGL